MWDFPGIIFCEKTIHENAAIQIIRECYWETKL